MVSAEPSLLAVSSDGLFSNPHPRCRSFDTNHVGRQPADITSLKLNYLFRGPVSKYSHLLRHWASGLQHRGLRRAHPGPLPPGLPGDQPRPVLLPIVPLSSPAAFISPRRLPQSTPQKTSCVQMSLEESVSWGAGLKTRAPHLSFISLLGKRTLAGCQKGHPYKYSLLEKHSFPRHRVTATGGVRRQWSDQVVATAPFTRLLCSNAPPPDSSSFNSHRAQRPA